MKFITNMFRNAGWIIALMAATGQAHATSNIECTGVNSDAGVSILIGAGPVLNALEASVALNERYITTYKHQEGEHANIVQFKANEYEVQLDLMDDQAEVLLASVRILKFIDKNNDESEPYQIGYMHLNGSQAVGITCEGP